MENKHDFVQIKVDEKARHRPQEIQKAFKMDIDKNKTLIVYNRINNYILDAVLKVVLDHDA